MADEQTHEASQSLRNVIGWVAVIVGGTFTAAFFTLALMGAYHGLWIQTSLEHVATILGLPCIALASLLIVLLFRTVSGNIEVKILGFEFKGASGPIIMWILCFLTITLGVVKTWDLKGNLDRTVVYPTRQH